MQKFQAETDPNVEDLISTTESPSGIRPRRLRRTDSLRSLVREHALSPDDFIYPLFVAEGNGERTPIPSMPGIFRESERTLSDALKDASAAGLKAVMLFGIPNNKDAIGSESLKSDGLFARMIKRAKDTCPELLVIPDMCFCGIHRSWPLRCADQITERRIRC